MIVKKLVLEEWPDKVSDELHSKFNLLTSNNVNSVGKSTYCRLLFYALGYNIPSTEGIKFNKINTTIFIENNKKIYVINRVNNQLIVKTEREKIVKSFTLPEQHLSFLAYVLEVDNLGIVKNLLGLMYIDQEKGWTLLNRGKVIGSNHFSIDELVSALKNIDCGDLFIKRDLIENEIEKYQAFLNMNSIKEEYYENNNNLEVISLGEDIKKKIATLQLQIYNTKNDIREIDQVIAQDKSFFEYIETMSLHIRVGNELIQVTKDNIENSCNIEYLKAHKTLLLNQLLRLEEEKTKCKRDHEAIINGTDMFGNNKVVDIEQKINMALGSINIDVETIKVLEKEARKEREHIKSEIRERVRFNNEYIDQIYTLFCNYAEELGVDKYISSKTDYIFTDNLKGKTGAAFQKLIIAYKVATIKVVERVINTKLFLVIDSPKAKELDDVNTKQIMMFLKKELSENQVLVASIFSEKDLYIHFDKKVEFKRKAIENR